MRYKVFWPFLAYTLLCVQTKLTEDDLKYFLQNTYEKEANQMCYKINMANLNRYKDMRNTTKEEIYTNTTLEKADWERNIWNKYFKDINPDDYKDASLKRQIRFLQNIGDAALDGDKLKQLTEIRNQMIKIYNDAKICLYSKQDCDLTREGIKTGNIRRIIIQSTNLDELIYLWKESHAPGAKIKDLFKTYVNLSNEAARANNYSDKGALWRDMYEDPNFVEDVDNLWAQVEPLYEEFHKYRAIKAKRTFGNLIDISDGLIPDHVYLSDLPNTQYPFPNVSEIDIDLSLKEQGYGVSDLFYVANAFFTELGLFSMKKCYDEKAGAMITEPLDGREVLCEANSWDFCDGRTFLLKMCTKVKYDDLTTIHHEMGHIQYYMQYKNQPHVFRSGANPGFHEAIGDAIGLAVATPTHMLGIHLLTNYTESDEASINYLMDMAINKIAFLPLAFIIDKWRWDVFSGAVKEDEWNSHWWHHRESYMKLKAPVGRSNETDFDPGVLMHVANDIPYIRYFVAGILQFQFYKSLCITAKKYNPANKTVPLHKCDFYQSRAAGKKLRAGLQLGRSKHWSETLEIMTGSKKISADSILEYFEPLYNFLKTENKKHEHYFYKNPEPEINICNLEWNERLLQNFKISRGPAFACIQKYIGWCELEV